MANKMLLKLNGITLVLDGEAALDVFRILCSQNLQEKLDVYKKDEATGNYGFYSKIIPIRGEAITLELLSATNYLLMQEQGDKSE